MQKTKILIAEDDGLLRSLLTSRLKKEGYAVITANDGIKAMKKIEYSHPDLIISNIMSPFVNGIEIIGFVKNELLMRTPIIILSAEGQEHTVAEAFSLGANDFMSKPFSPNELVVRIKNVLTNRK